MPAAPGTEVGLYVDLLATVHTGDIIETQTGRRYLVTFVRKQMRGEHIGRQHLRAVVMDGSELTYESMQPDHPMIPTVHKIRWYKRSNRGQRKTRRALALSRVRRR